MYAIALGSWKVPSMPDPILHVPTWLSGGQDRDVVISTRVRFARNLGDALFPWRASLTESAETRERLSSTIQRLFPSAVEYRLEGMDAPSLQAFAERSWIDASSSSDPGRSLFLAENGASAMLINETDHFRIASFGAGSDLSQPYARARAFESSLDEEVSWASDEQYGYLTARAEDVGSAMRLSALVFIPGILSTDVFERVARGLITSGIEPRLRADDYTGHTIDKMTTIETDTNDDRDASPYVELSARAKLGLTEAEFLEAFSQSLSSLVEGERRTRDLLLKSRRDELEDSAYRAIGILRSARLLGEAETRRRIADVRAGLAYGLLPQVIAKSELDDTDLFASPDILRLLIGPGALRLSKIFDGTGFSLERARAELVREALPRYDI